jgi:tetratricopeptide (TPR) repeat protein
LSLRLEFDAPLHLFEKLPSQQMAKDVLQSSVDPRWLRTMGDRMGVRYDSAQYHLALGEYRFKRTLNPMIGLHSPVLQNVLDNAAKHLETALSMDPQLVAAHDVLARVRSFQTRPDARLVMLEQLLREAPDDATVHIELAQELMKNKRAAEAIDQLREALRLMHGVSATNASLMCANNLAWILATYPDAKLRNGSEAVRLATEACEADGYKQLTLLDTLAVALAEAGKFDEAIRTSQRLIRLAADQPSQVEAIKARIKLYQASQPYHQE